MKIKILLFIVFSSVLKLAEAQPGSLDHSFGKNGVVTADLGSTYNYSLKGEKVLLLPDGNFFTIHRDEPIIIKRRLDGSVDSGYGLNGYSRSALGDVIDAVLQSDGKIVILGFGNFVLARFNSNGNLDSSFGTNGVQAHTDLGMRGTPRSLAIQNDGKLVVAGFVNRNANRYFEISRYNSNGSPDTSFSNDAETTIDFGFARASDRGGDYPENDIANAVAIQKDGKIVVAGSALNYSFGDEFAVVRLNRNGNPDSTFDFDGKQTTAFGSDNDYCGSVTIQSDQKIVAAGSAFVRYNTNGSLDSTFSQDGKQMADFPVISVIAQKDGKIVAAGSLSNGSNNDFVIARYNTNGSLDKTFDGDGEATTDFNSSDDNVAAMAIRNDGKIVLIGNNSDNPLLTRYNTNGSLDKTFNKNGKLIESLGLGNTVFTSLAIQKDGKVIAGGSTWNGNDNDWVIARYNTDGSADKTFNGNGVRITDFGLTEEVNSVAIQNDGRILAAGGSIARFNINGSIDSTFSGDGKDSNYFGFLEASAGEIATQADGKIVVGYSVLDSNYDIGFLIARYNTNGSLDNTFSGDGIQTTSRGDSFFIATSLAVQADGKIVVAGYNYNDLEVIRFNTNGSLDNTFGGDGIQITNVGFDNAAANSIAIQKDGKILVEGSDRGSQGLFFLVRYNTNGTLDTTFNYDGKQTNNFGKYGYPASVAIENDGKILAGVTSNGNFVLIRYNKDGSEDNTFGENGIQVINIGGTGARLLNTAITGDKLYAAGYANFPGIFGVVARYLLTTNKPPTVKIISPSNNATYTAPATITLNASATDTDGTISSVKFYNGGTLLGTDSTSPYSYTLTNLAAGNYFFVAKAADNNGGRSSSASVAVSVLAPVNKAPLVNITSPANNAVYNAPATITINATATDFDGTVSFVRFFNGGTLLKTDSISPYTCTVSNLSAGNYSFVAKATDNKGLTGSSPSVAVAVSVSANKAPVVSITSPDRNAVYTAPATITINASASDADGTIASVKFYSGATLLSTDFTSSYTYTLTNAAAGTYSITAKATDNKGLFSSSASVVMTVVAAPNKAPVVSITSPANNAVYNSPSVITIHAAATDADGKISNVKFYNGGTLLATDSTSPYSYTFNNPAPGNYALTAKATDNLGLFSSSATTSITVSASANKAPVVSVTSPDNNVVSAVVNLKVSDSLIVSSKPYSKTEKTASKDALSLRLSPNPASSIVNIQTNIAQQNRPATLSIITLSGIVLKTMQISKTVIQLDVSLLASGMYILKVISGKEVAYRQFVKLQ